MYKEVKSVSKHGRPPSGISRPAKTHWLLGISCLFIFPALVSCAVVQAESQEKYRYTSAEEAMEALIEAYRSKDIEAAVEAKGFREEAKQMLRDLDVSIEHDPEQVALTAEVLELSYRRKIEEYGFPDFSGAVCEVGLLRHYQNNIYIATEDCESESGYASYFNIYVAETKYGWRVLNSAPRK